MKSGVFYKKFENGVAAIELYLDPEEYAKQFNRAPTLNWSASGDVLIAEAELFLADLEMAIKEAKKIL